jgi:hypothetical protein
MIHGGEEKVSAYMDTVTRCLGRVVDILEASGAFDPGSSPGRGVFLLTFCYIVMNLPFSSLSLIGLCMDKPVELSLGFSNP